MPLKLTRKAPGWDGAIVGGNTLTLRLPIGLTFHQVFTEYAFQGAAAAPIALSAAVGEIRLVANGKPVWAVPASMLDSKNQFDSRGAAGTAAGGILTMDFDRYNLRTRPATEFTQIGTGTAGDPTPLTTFIIEMDLQAAVTGGTLTTRMRQSESAPLGLFKKLRKFVHTFTGAGQFQIADYPKGDLINSIAWFQSANNLTNVRLERDDFIMFDRGNALNSRIQTDGVRTPQAGLYVYDTTEDGDGTDQLVTKGINDLRFYMTVDGAMTITSIIEFIGALEV